MKNRFLKIISILSISLLTGCYGVNSETSEIGNINSVCLPKNAWTEIQKKNSTDKITDSTFMEGLKYVKNHFLKPEYIIYFQSEPKEIVGCDYYSIRVVYNPEIADFGLDGLSPQLSDKEQTRIRNRVLNLVKEYACEEGKIALTKEMNEPAVFSKEYYDNN